MTRIFLAGYGGVGRAFHDLVVAEAASLRSKPQVVAIARRAGVRSDPEGIAPGAFDDAAPAADTALQFAKDGAYDVLVELTPTDLDTGGAALDHVRAALARGKHVVTANKGPVVVAYRELMDLARANGAQFRFEGTVAGAVPVLNTHDRCLTGNPVTRVDGILNGTSNFILTRMMDEGLDFDAALEEAQALGYAEADPTNDVDGYDAAAKIVILANHVLGLDIGMKDVACTGIRSVSAGAIRLARTQGYAIRLIGSVDAETGRARVAPRLVPRTSSLNVTGPLNVVRYRTKHAGPLTFVGRGAGGMETATAVLSDLASLD